MVPSWTLNTPVKALPGETPMLPVLMLVKAPLKDSAVPAWRAKVEQVPRGISVLAEQCGAIITAAIDNAERNMFGDMM